MHPDHPKNIITVLACLGLAQACLAQPADRQVPLQDFRLIAVSLLRHNVDPAFVDELRKAGFPISKPELKYRFFAELPDAVIDARLLRFSRVQLASGEELDFDDIHMAGKTYRGVQHSYSPQWGMDLDHTGQRLMIDLALNRQQVEDLALVQGKIKVIRGEGGRTVRTDLMTEEQGVRDEKTGATVTSAMRWGVNGRNIQFDLPVPRNRLGAVQVLDAENQPIPWVVPHYYNVIDVAPLGREGTTVKLFVEKDQDTPFKLGMTIFESSREEELPFVIKDVRASLRPATQPEP